MTSSLKQLLRQVRAWVSLLMCGAALNALQARLENPRASPRTQARPWREALRTLQVMRQNLEYYDAQVVYLVRDRHMAQNVATELEEAGPQGKVFLWAHNAHVSRANRFQGAESPAAWKRVRPMGHHLARRFGAQLFVMGFEFNEGAFQLPGRRSEDGTVLELQEAVLPAAPGGTLAAVLASAGLENSFIRLTPPADGDVRRWLGRPVRVHDYGGGALDEERSLVPIPLLDSYDALVFIRRTSRAHPLAPR
jgi:erythromycin esterase